MTRRTKRWLFWAPRVLGVLFALFVGMFALDVFSEGRVYIAQDPLPVRCHGTFDGLGCVHGVVFLQVKFRIACQDQAIVRAGLAPNAHGILATFGSDKIPNHVVDVRGS